MIWDINTILLVDPRVIAEEDNVSLVREDAYKHEANPLFTIEDTRFALGRKPNAYGGYFVAREGGRYRLWYHARGIWDDLKTPHDQEKLARVLYAESDDGIRFNPVHTGLAELDGSRDNNLVPFPDGGRGPVRVCGFLHDPLDREYPYKCVYHLKARGEEAEPGQLARFPWLRGREFWFIWGIGRSRDGLQWEPPRNEPFLVRANPESAKLHRALDGGLVISDQGWPKYGARTDMGWNWEGRDVAGWITYDLETAHPIPGYLFELKDRLTRIYRIDAWPAWNNTQWVQPHVGLVTARKGPTVLGLNGYLYGCEAVETFAQTANVGLCVSDTGIVFREVVPFKPFIPNGNRGAWDHGMVAQKALVEHGDETRIYYNGGSPGNEATAYQPGLAWLPRDRFGYLMIRGMRHRDPEPMQASFGLKPVVLPARPALAINVSHVSERATVRAELADEHGQPIPGYGYAESVPVTEPGLRRPLLWQEGRTGAGLAGRSVRLRLRLGNPSCGYVYHDSPRVYAVYTGT